MRIHIVAGNYQQARDWAREGQLGPNDWTYIGSPSTLRGLGPDAIIAKVGTYNDRQDIEEVLEYIQVIKARKW